MNISEYIPTKFPFIALWNARVVVARTGFLELFQNIVPKGEWYRGKFPADDYSVGHTIRFGDATFSQDADENNVIEQIEQAGRNARVITDCKARADFVFAVILFCQCAETVSDYILDSDQHLLPEKCPLCCEYLSLKPFGEFGSNCECSDTVTEEAAESEAIAIAEATAKFEAKHKHVDGCKCTTCFLARRAPAQPQQCCHGNALATAEAEYDDAELEAKRHEHVIGLEFPACKCFTCFVANVHETTNVAPKPHPYLE